jgi:hypothetical protein
MERALASLRVFSKDQRVSHTAIVENKRLSHALAMVKAQQDIKHMPTVMTNSTKNGYKKHPRQIYGPDYKVTIAAPAVEMTGSILTFLSGAHRDISIGRQHGM